MAAQDLLLLDQDLLGPFHHLDEHDDDNNNENVHTIDSVSIF